MEGRDDDGAGAGTGSGAGAGADAGAAGGSLRLEIPSAQDEAGELQSCTPRSVEVQVLSADGAAAEEELLSEEEELQSVLRQVRIVILRLSSCQGGLHTLIGGRFHGSCCA